MSNDEPGNHDGRSAHDEAGDGLAKTIVDLVRRLREVQMSAREHGTFIEDRDLVGCPRCGLLEDVLVDGRLITCRQDSLGRDTGLRFVDDPHDAGSFTCPECGGEAVPDEG
ncbi:MAG: hypothetical protein H6704_14955 [Myxococcales bacterium]|nr:hypothetical protein [Myxococcales bacterium]